MASPSTSTRSTGTDLNSDLVNTYICSSSAGGGEAAPAAPAPLIAIVGAAAFAVGERAQLVDAMRLVAARFHRHHLQRAAHLDPRHRRAREQRKFDAVAGAAQIVSQLRHG